MQWHIGQKVRCNHPAKPLEDCFVLSVEASIVTISCPERGMIISGSPHRLERMGWMLLETEDCRKNL